MMILRFENEKGRGPFHQPHYNKMAEIIGDPDYHSSLPNPHEEGLSFWSRHLCGCQTAKQLVRWFPFPIRQYLKANGFTLKAYNVPEEHVQVGRYQVIFDPSYHGDFQ